MENNLKKSKIDKFLKDEIMSEAVYESIRDSYLKKRGITDVHYLAGERIALSYLDEAWKDLEKNKTGEESNSPQIKQVGL